MTIADITKIVAPLQASEGEQVIIDVSIKNISDVDKNLAVTGRADSTDITFQFTYLLVSPGQTLPMRGWFTMPAKNVKITAWGFYWSGTEWIHDDTATKDISLVVLKPEFADFGILQYNPI